MKNVVDPVSSLCSSGMECEFAGDFKKAISLYKKAWKISDTSYQKCVAAHYVARHQKNTKIKLQWNLLSLKNARKTKFEIVNPVRSRSRSVIAASNGVKSFFPSLYINIGQNYESLNKIKIAKKYYALAEKNIKYLPKNSYGSNIRKIIQKR